jgi:hypothetical protein
MIPFFVVDRPMSLNILKTSFVTHPKLKFGLLTHALVSANFLEQFARFPCMNNGECWLKSHPTCESPNLREKQLCKLGKRMNKSIVRVCDYGIFEKGSRTISYHKLFEMYEIAKADYGVMQDILGDAKGTVVSARKAMREYKKKKRRFKLVLVAQGKTVDEYLWCFDQLRRLGGNHIAVGGLLRKRPRSARYLYVSSNGTLEHVLKEIRKEFNPKWLFVLGVYHPDRHRTLVRNDIYGSDYKGWIFQYEHRRELLQRLHEQLALLEKAHVPNKSLARARARRDRLARIEQRERSNYVRTKNDSKHNSILKAAIRRRLKKVQLQLASIDKSLLQIRLRLAERNGLPKRYPKEVQRFAAAIKRDEQTTRVSGVHRYLEHNVYNQC